jgi:hypothetical protein
MSQPQRVYVPEKQSPPTYWSEPVDPATAEIERPASLVGRRLPTNRLSGRPGPDQGYALSLYDLLYSNEVHLGPEEDPRDIRVGTVAVASALASAEGRAPMARDIREALDHFGLLSDQERPERRQLFRGVAHDALALRELVDSTLKNFPAPPASI